MAELSADVVQFHVSKGFDTEREARRASRTIAIDLIEHLQAEGWNAFEAPPRPLREDGAWDVFAHCRILVKWINHGLPTDLAGTFATRVDTIASRKAMLIEKQ